MSSDTILLVPEGEWSGYVRSSRYKYKKTADKISYAWDNLIGLFTKNLLDGTSVSVLGEEPSASAAEPALRIMAEEPRLMRRALGAAFSDALHSAKMARKDRFTRVVLPGRSTALRNAYAFMVLDTPHFSKDDSYEHYRTIRASMLETYCYGVLYKNRSVKRIVGIAVDAEGHVLARGGRSEDLIAVEVGEWSKDFEAEIKERIEKHDILRPDRQTWGHLSVEEYGPVREAGNRKQRRAARKQRRR